MSKATFSCGHQHFETVEGPRHLMRGPIVPEGELWWLRLIAAKNNQDPNVYPSERTTAEISVCVFLPPRPSSHEVQPPGEWVLLEGVAGAPQFRPVKWERGPLPLPLGSQLGAWFRGAKAGDVVELNAIYDVEEQTDEAEDDISDAEAIDFRARGLSVFSR